MTLKLINFSDFFIGRLLLYKFLNKSCLIAFYCVNRKFTRGECKLIFIGCYSFRNISKMGLTGQKLSLKTTKTVSRFLKRYGNWGPLINTLNLNFKDAVMIILFLYSKENSYDPYNACGWHCYLRVSFY